jgi:hypothetical protein
VDTKLGWHILKFTQRTVEIWNNLTSKVVTAPTTMSFESRLDKFWENQPRKYNYSHEIVINTTGHDLSIRWPLVVDSSLVRRKLDTSSSYLPVRILEFYHVTA